MTPTLATADMVGLSRLWADAPAFATLTLCLALSTAPVLCAMALDNRMFDGDSTWLKPLKFLIALAIYTGTLAFFARYLPADWRASPLWGGYVAAVSVCIVAEVIWIGGAAALGTASHFNIGSPFWNTAYGLMGLAAVVLTSATLVMGIGIWFNAGTGLAPALQLSIALGLVLTCVLTIPVASTMAAALSHHVGTPITGARLAVLGWSREVGDLRAPHFMATHALHAVPVAGWVASRLLPGPQATLAVLVAAAAYALLVVLMFAQALGGRPVI